MSRILIVAREGDTHSLAVAWGLRRLGQEPVVWFWSQFPKRDSAWLQLGGQGPSFGLQIDGVWHSEPFDAIWVRRKGDPAPMAGSHPDDVDIIRMESGKFIDNLLPHLGHAGTRWVNHPGADYRCRNKSDQLLAAQALGFRIPQTVIGNDIGATRALFERQRQIVHKAFTNLRWENEDGSRTVGRTSAIQAANLAEEFAVRACPGIYQENVRKRHELRVTVMGDTVIAAAIDSQRDGPTTDWRCEGGRGNTNLRATTLDPALEERCRALCRRLGVAFGCIDLIVRPDGEVVFLEINCCGQFLFKEVADPSLAMLERFCRFLAHGDAAPAGAASPSLRFADFQREEEARPDGARWLAGARC